MVRIDERLSECRPNDNHGCMFSINERVSEAPSAVQACHVISRWSEGELDCLLD